MMMPNCGTISSSAARPHGSNLCWSSPLASGRRSRSVAVAVRAAIWLQAGAFWLCDSDGTLHVDDSNVALLTVDAPSGGGDPVADNLAANIGRARCR
jgi:hypothetical protein